MMLVLVRIASCKITRAPALHQNNVQPPFRPPLLLFAALVLARYLKNPLKGEESEGKESCKTWIWYETQIKTNNDLSKFAEICFS